MPRYSDRDRYTDADTGVLKNLLGIRDQASLDLAEAEFVAARSTELSFSPIQGQFDLLYLRSIHRHLFRDVFDWAGELRNVDISKGDNRFAHHAYLENAAQSIFELLRNEGYLSGIERDVFSARVAFYLGELNALHPFRDGNGRAQREFVQLLARKNGLVFLWKEVSQAEMLGASIASFRGDSTQLAEILRRIVREIAS